MWSVSWEILPNQCANLFPTQRRASHAPVKSSSVTAANSFHYRYRTPSLKWPSPRLLNKNNSGEAKWVRFPCRDADPDLVGHPTQLSSASCRRLVSSRMMTQAPRFRQQIAGVSQHCGYPHEFSPRHHSCPHMNSLGQGFGFARAATSQTLSACLILYN